jgi:hypothetical protein
LYKIAVRKSNISFWFFMTVKILWYSAYTGLVLYVSNKVEN